MRVDFNAGADPLLELEFNDGDDQTIEAGNGISLAALGSVRFFEETQHQLECQLGLGFKLSTMIPTENADLTFLRYPMDLLAFYRNEALYFRVGGGVYFSPINSLSGSGSLEDLDLQFNSALGAVIQADLAFEKVSVGLRYTRLNYSLDEAPDPIAAHSVGLTFGFTGLLAEM